MNKKTILLLFVLMGLLSACSGQLVPEAAAGFETPIPNQTERHQDSDHAGHNHVHLDQADATAEMKVVLVPSELVVGPNRFAVGLFDAEGRMINDGLIHFHYFDLSNPNEPVLESETDATRLQTPDGLTTIFAQERVFDRAGDWGVEVQARLPAGTTAVKRIRFQVLADSPALTPGELAHVFTLEGHRWSQEPGLSQILTPETAEVLKISAASTRPQEPARTSPNLLSSVQVGALEAITIVPLGGAGGPVALPGDYLYGDHREPYRDAGLWGLFRVYTSGAAGINLRPLPGR